MATNTTNLNLVKPADGESYSVGIVNANSDKIDEFAGKQGVATLSTVADVTALGNALLTFGNTMSAEIRRIGITFSAASGIFSATRYIGEIRRLFSDVQRYRVTLYENTTNKVIDGVYNGTSWTWDVLALNSQLTTKFGTSLSANANLNDITDVGFYSADSASIASSLVNCPVTVNFAMLVMYKGGLQNQLISIGNELYTRTRASGGWGHWYKFTGTDTGA